VFPGFGRVNWTGKEFFMSKIVSKFTLAAGLMIALAVISCAGSKPPDPDSGFTDSSNPSDEFTKMCRTELKDYLCGVGENTSSNTQIARDIATANARNELAAKIKFALESSLKRNANNFAERGGEAVFTGLVQNVSGVFSNVDIYETKTQYNKTDGKYRIYALVVIKKDEVRNTVQNELSKAQILSDAAATKLFMDMIDEELNKAR
jgi:hypothetical protein